MRFSFGEQGEPGHLVDGAGRQGQGKRTYRGFRIERITKLSYPHEAGLGHKYMATVGGEVCFAGTLANIKIRIDRLRFEQKLTVRTEGK